MNIHIVITVFNRHFKAVSIPQTGEIKDTQHSLINTNICFSNPMVSGNLVLSLQKITLPQQHSITAPTHHSEAPLIIPQVCMTTTVLLALNHCSRKVAEQHYPKPSAHSAISYSKQTTNYMRDLSSYKTLVMSHKCQHNKCWPALGTWGTSDPRQIQTHPFLQNLFKLFLQLY